MTLLEKFKGTLTAQNVFLDENTGGKGKYFKARFLQPGLVKYSFGVCVLEKDTIDKFIHGFVGCPVIIGHKDVTSENAKELSCGNICHIWYDDLDGWYWGDGIIDNDEALELINQGYNVSCQYEITEFANNTTNALHNGNPYDKVILNGKPEHLAIVDKPRYENALIAVNALDLTAENEDKWITIKPNGEEGKGKHLLLKDGETPKEAIERTYGKKEDDLEKHIYKERSEKDKRQDEKHYQQKQKLRDYYYEHPKELTKEKAQEHWDKDKIDLFDLHEELNKKEDKKEEIGENLPEHAKLRTMDNEELIKKYLINKDSLDPEDDLKFYKQFHQTELIDRIYKKHDKDKAKNCIIQAINELKEHKMFKQLFNINRKDTQMEKDEMKSLFIECLQECLQAKNEEDKEDDKEDKKLENEEDKDLKEKEDDKEKEAENKCKNEVVDKRDIIRQIMAIAGKEEASEDVKTIAKLAEKLAYDKSEADDKADNEEEDEKKKEDAKNKAKNSLEEMRALFSKSEVSKSASSYVSRADAIELGNELF